MIRFFVSPDNISENIIRLGAEVSAHIRSLRLRPDELFVISDGDCNDYTCRLGVRSDEGTAIADIIEKRPSLSEPTVKCVNYIAYAKGGRLDYAVAKSVELGAKEIVLYKSARCVALPRNIPNKVERLQKIALETAKQSGRGVIPKVSAVEDFRSVIDEVKKSDALPLFFYENEEDLHIKAVLEQEGEFYNAAIITGPEGGFEPHEVDYALGMGIRPISLGPRILLCETAPVVALTAVMYHTGNLA